MDRRKFLKMLGLGALSPTVPKFASGNVPWSEYEEGDLSLEEPKSNGDITSEMLAACAVGERFTDFHSGMGLPIGRSRGGSMSVIFSISDDHRPRYIVSIMDKSSRLIFHGEPATEDDVENLAKDYGVTRSVVGGYRDLAELLRKYSWACGVHREGNPLEISEVRRIAHRADGKEFAFLNHTMAFDAVFFLASSRQLVLPPNFKEIDGLVDGLLKPKRIAISIETAGMITEAWIWAEHPRRRRIERTWDQGSRFSHSSMSSIALAVAAETIQRSPLVG